MCPQGNKSQVLSLSAPCALQPGTCGHWGVRRGSQVLKEMLSGLRSPATPDHPHLHPQPCRVHDTHTTAPQSLPLLLTIRYGKLNGKLSRATVSTPDPSTASGAQVICINPTDCCAGICVAPRRGAGDCTLSNTRSCREEEAISVVLVNMKPLVMLNTRNMDTMLPGTPAVPPSARSLPAPCTSCVPCCCEPHTSLLERETQEAPRTDQLSKE